MRSTIPCWVFMVLTTIACGGARSGGDGGGGNGVCSREPSGTECQACLSSARTACVNRGTCATQFNTLESCNVRVGTEGCFDAAGNPATGCCSGQSDALLRCLNSECAEWNAC